MSYLGLTVPGDSLPSFHLSESSYVCFVCNVQAFQLHLVGEMGKYGDSIFPEEEALCAFITVFFLFSFVKYFKVYGMLGAVLNDEYKNI